MVMDTDEDDDDEDDDDEDDDDEGWLYFFTSTPPVPAGNAKAAKKETGPGNKERVEPERRKLDPFLWATEWGRTSRPAYLRKQISGEGLLGPHVR